MFLSKLNNRPKKICFAIFVLVLAWFVLDFSYFQFVSWKLRKWENSVARDANGVLVDCEAFSKGEGDTAILLLHGINDTPFTYRKMANELVSGEVGQKFHVRAMRLPGFGEPVPTYASKNAEAWIEAVEREAAVLRESHERVFIVAHSLGGAVTVQALLRAGARQSKLFDGVVLLAPAIEVSSRRSPLLPVRWWHRLSSGLVFTKFTYSPFPPDTKDPNLVSFPNRTPFTPRSVINETFHLIDSNRGKETEIHVPILLVLSDQDRVNDHLASQRWFEKITSDRKELFWNNQAGHPLQYDLGWDDVTSKIANFVDGAN